MEILWHAADAVKLAFCDDPEEYSDSERGQTLNKLCDALPGAAAALKASDG